MRRFLYSILFFCFLSNVSYSQNRIDSLKSVIETSSTKTKAYVNLLNDLEYSYWIVDSNESLNYRSEALVLSDSMNYNNGKARANRVLGVAHWARGNYLEAFKSLDSELIQ